ncbi:LysR family transcriptional regulator [Mycolicibacterium goodii]|uniref:LysR family transcriptional regulator n=1 Tax=Mycolicibacterium goodii TaxID=134601 RepID=A0ABS6HS26_MYCGD|nr:LysR family transcriptional regulator [Mycolicibacterium goodii]MBU8809458.1 LysR family transcriptional regulator [Mycolicibacterium goodii]MBU8815770.1 LysR family transcriptional regulator [Mycolicibacterium goodii]MBU8825496.1 LysR family transcriptional regulator [Mycolicibacterium goodii]MBU8838642.1 LysR family transcriptional regulator [Mycolicibacterium goodii]ULN50700.1 LysR family transcriptional regulator [Mycolicibacterium goodii]
MFSADNLRYFLEVARTGRLNDAARNLGVDHTTVGRRITALEKSFGQRLFDRSPGGWQLTEAGADLFPHAETVESAVIAAYETRTSSAGPLTGTVRVATTDGFGAFVMAPRLVDLRRRHPHLDIEMVTATEHRSLTARHFDIAVTLEEPPPRGVVVQELAGYDLRLYATPEYLDAAPPIDELADLARHTLIWYIDALLDVAPLRILESLPHKQRVAIQTNNITGHWMAARGGLGIAPLPQYVAEADPTLRSVLPQMFSVRRRYWMVIPRELRQVGRVRAVAQFLCEIVSDNPYLIRPS